MPPDSPPSGPQVSLIGGEQASEEERENAHAVGQKLGEADAVLVCGGGGGVMEAACRGLRDSGQGLAVGIRPEIDQAGANDYLDVLLPTGIRQARNLAVVLSGQAVIAVGGGPGTLSELGFAMKYNRPVFGIDTWEHSRFPFESDLSPSEAVEGALSVGAG